MALTQARPYIRKLRGLGPYSSDSRSGSTRRIEKQKNIGKSRINTEILYTQDARRETLKIITLAKKNIPSFNPYEGKLRWERIIVRIKEKAYGYTL